MNCEDFRGRKQELSAKVINKDSSKKPWYEGVFPMKTVVWRSFFDITIFDLWNGAFIISIG